jgi:hypothetical protein
MEENAASQKHKAKAISQAEENGTGSRMFQSRDYQPQLSGPENGSPQLPQTNKAV